jgi:hypothetical protein
MNSDHPHEDRALVSPDPVGDALDVSFNLTATGPVTLEVFSADGRQYGGSLSLVDVPAGRHSEHIETTGLAAGTYFLRIRSAGGLTMARFVVVR